LSETIINMSINSKEVPENTNSGKKGSRRNFINKTIGGIALLGVTGGEALGKAESEITNGDKASGKLKIVVTGGHPGDPEYGCGGTIAGYTDSGHEVVMLYLNRGEAGINGKTYSEAARIRTAEAMRACEILKARPVFATQTDGQSVVDASHYDLFYEIMAQEQPDIIFTQWPIDNHPDHRAISTLAYNSWQRLRKADSSNRPLLYFYEVSNGEDTLMFSPNYYVDITASESRKREACFAHASQSPEMFYSLQDQVSRFRGIEYGCKMAEGFIAHVASGPHLLKQ
jgi:LmbE family N-acetylglucosaminyl deacetylase